MRAKTEDARIVYKRECAHMKSIKEEKLKQFGGRRFKLRRLVKQINEKIRPKAEKLADKNNKKISRYLINQAEERKKQNPNIFTETKVPQRLEQYSSLPIFKRPGDLPDKKPPVGPYICDQKIILSDNEIKILSRDPKYSLMEEVNEQDFALEVEKALSKYRMTEAESEREKKKKEKTSGLIREKEEEKIKERNREEEKARL